MKKITLKTKIIMIGICTLSLLILFTSQVIRKHNQGGQRDIILREGEMITIQEIKHLLSFVDYNEEEVKEILQEPESVDSVADSSNPDYLTFEELISIIHSIGDKWNIEEDKLFDNLSFQVKEEKGKKAVLVTEFLEVYEGYLNLIPNEKVPVTEEKLFVIGIPDSLVNEKEKIIMSTDKGRYQIKNSLDYKGFYEDGDLIQEEAKAEDEDSFANPFNINKYIDYKVNAMVSGDKLVYVKEILDEETILFNAWITHGSGQEVSTFINEVSKEFTTKHNLSDEIEGIVGDLIIQNQQMVGIRIKPDRIDGKVLLTDKEFIEVQGYGKVPLDENYKIYKIYGELAQEITNSILVGYESTDFVVADGKIVAALIKEPIKAENIRVLIKTNQFEKIYHNEVALTCDKDFTVTSGEETTSYTAGTSITYTLGDESLTSGRVIIKPVEESGKITLLSVKRSYGNPAYRGTMEIDSNENGIIIINELSLEEYLYAVIPSEMPTSYGLEALKSQAVCARSYAYNQLMANSYSEYGAHVDDSVSYQVYNNIEENENSILAVKDTFGQVLKYGDSIITAYYFSTSSGHTASVGEVWGGEADYLIGKLQQVHTGDEVEVSNTNDQVDFSNEETFRNFILTPAQTTYDSEFSWYRWKVTISLKDLTETVNEQVVSRYKAQPNNIQTLVKASGGVETYESLPIESIGKLNDVKILKREKSGIVNQIKLIGSEKTIKVIGEYNIRTILSPHKTDIIRQDGSAVSKQSMLPSAFFIMDKDGENINFHGGGYGHGVGMSQNGAKAMSDLGKEYKEILKHYYTGIDVGYIYE